MASVFQDKLTCTIASYFTGSTNKLSLAGINPDSSITPDQAATEINKFIAIVGKSVTTMKMERSIKQEAVESE